MNDFTQNRYITSTLYWIKGNYIKIIIVFLFLSFVFGWFFYKNLLQEEKSQQASILFDEFSFLLNNDQSKINELISIYEKTKKEYPDQIYAILMNLEISQIKYDSKDFQDALNRLREANFELEKRGDEANFLKDLSRIKLALLLISQGELIEAKDVLNRNFNYFNELKYEFLGDAEINSSNIEEAKKNYELALELTSSNVHKELIKIKLSSLTN